MLLSTITGQVTLLVYIGIFAVAIKLRFSKPDVLGAYRVPSGNIGICLIASIAITICVIVMTFSFLPPSQIDVGNVTTYESILIGGIIIICIPPFLMKSKNNGQS